jgi:betaine-aldehyde dehydrogenase
MTESFAPIYDRRDFYIDGGWRAPSSGAFLSVISPGTEQQIGWVPDATTADIDTAVEAARRAFDDGPWPRMTAAERGERMAVLAKLLWPAVEDMASVMTSEMGATIAFTRTAAAPAPVAMLEYYANLGQTLSLSEEREGPVGRWTVSREPVGVVAAIVPWNGPLYLAMFKLGPALLAGCTVVLKPALESPLSTFLIADALEEAGIPPGVLNVIPGGAAIGQHLVNHPQIDKISFTGSTTAGRWIMENCAKDLKRITLELGGKSAALVLDDSDLAVALPELVFGIIQNNGEVCVSNTRLLVPRSRHDEIVDAVAGAFAELSVGNPFDAETDIGPLITAKQRERVLGYVDIGRSEGARVASGGGRPADLDRGWYVEPTLLVGVDNSMRVAQEEIFGPVLSVIPYGDDAAGVKIANDTKYGLGAAVFSSDVSRAEAVAARVRAGTVNINKHTFDFTMPFGGFKASGLGREGGPEALGGYLEYKVTGPHSEAGQPSST